MGTFFGIRAKRAARRICEPLYEAGNAHGAASNLAVLAWQRFHADFGELIEQSARAKKSTKRTMDWSEA